MKAIVRAPEDVVRLLDERTAARVEVYRDTYYDRPDGRLETADQELRVRSVQGVDGVRTVLTFKGAAVHTASGSKPEHESLVGDAEAVHAILRGLGYVETISFEKYCRNYEFEAYGRRMLATLVRVPELNGTFLEVESLVEGDELQAALDDIRTVLSELGIGPGDLTRDTYTNAVRTHRR